MFKEIEKTKIFITENVYLRYDIYAMAEAEKAGIDFLRELPTALASPEQAVKYLKIGLYDCFRRLKLSESEVSEAVAKIIDATGAAELAALMLAATKAALPQPTHGAKPQENENGDIRPLMHFFLDVMGRTTREFLHLTLREITERKHDYCVAMGYEKPIKIFKRYDDD